MTSTPGHLALVDPDPNDPFWAVEHLARALFVKVDTVREHTYRSDFPLLVTAEADTRWLRRRVEHLAKGTGRVPQVC